MVWVMSVGAENSRRYIESCLQTGVTAKGVIDISGGHFSTGYPHMEQILKGVKKITES